VNFLSRFHDPLYAISRFIIGLLFAGHGAMKLFGWFGGKSGGPLPPKMMAAGVIEFAGGLMIAFGLLTTIAAFICCGEMAVAYFTVHAKMPPSPISPWENKGEMAVLYCFVFLYIAAHGGGKYSIDALFGRQREHG